MRKFLIAPMLTMVLVAVGIFGVNFFLKPEPVQATSVSQTVEQCVNVLGIGAVCARVDGDRVKVDAAGILVLDQPLPKVTVSGPTIRVTLPRVTVTRPPVTITLPRVTEPAITLPRQTVTVRLPGATTTATLPGQTIAGPTVPGQRVTITPTVVPVTITGSNGQPIQTSVTITPSPLPGSVTTKPVMKEKEVRVSVPAAIGIGVGVLIIGLILGLLAIYAAYAVGYKDSEDAERTAWQKFRADVFGKKDEGEN